MKVWLIAHAFIYNDKGRVLILRRSKENDVLPSIWDIPGGSCEPGEDPVDAAIRETQEETDLKIFNLKLFAHTSNVDSAKDSQFVRFIFLARYQGGEIHLNPREHESFIWIDPMSLSQQPLVDYLPKLLSDFGKRNID